MKLNELYNKVNQLNMMQKQSRKISHIINHGPPVKKKSIDRKDFLIKETFSMGTEDWEYPSTIYTLIANEKLKEDPLKSGGMSEMKDGSVEEDEEE